ncbi:glycerophosphodiester phosphodiesterase [Rhizobium halophytocola]|uniref:Glycerophosphoryl diester phosphodiesterase n=1 Tax=Rhizobium halophytocola TaxID=735519 RepID=A0ABS4DTY0_9HYPH|nr:glycerophosphodiester phosphodiesterase family protein [Rhizobium halophytocola]MBP1849144.1 glycerophosphoryl diester phosphodiesterase [Rhizobium halophytocola]
MRNSIAWPHRPDHRPLTIAHRGASAHAAENTLAAFRTAALLGADMWEIDVQLTQDGVPVVSHDAGLGRAVGIDRDIADLTLPEMKALAPDIPSLAETVALAKALGQSLYVELKADGSGVIAAALLHEMRLERAALGSFKHAEIAALKAVDCPYPLAVLVPLDANPFQLAEQSDADIIHLCWERGGERPQDLATDELLADAEKRGLGVVLWHEERRSVLSDIRALPVLGICTNNPEMMAGTDSLDMRGIGLVCHRGANHFAPENTLAAARLSFEQGAPYVELDVRETADGALVVIHDATLERTTNGTGAVTDRTLAQLKTLDAGSWFSPHFKNERIPTLSEMIALAQSYGRKLYIENKSVAPRRLVELVDDMDFLDDCFFWSGDANLQSGMRTVSQRASIKAGYRAVATPGDADPSLKPSIIEMTIDDYIAHAPDCLARGLKPMMQYFGDDPEVFDRIIAIAPVMINLDRADLLLAALRRAQRQAA